MLTLQFRQTCYTELQFLIIVSEVKEWSRILSPKSIICRLLVLPTVDIYISVHLHFYPHNDWKDFDNMYFDDEEISALT
jgi:hypothetical protein